MWFNKEKIFLGLDVGSGFVKAIIFKKICLPAGRGKSGDPLGKKIIVLASSFQGIEESGVFNGRNLEFDIMHKAVSVALENARRNLFLSGAERKVKKKIEKKKRWQAVVTFSPEKFKARVVLQNFVRKNPKEKISSRESRTISQEILEKAKKDGCKNLFSDLGILPDDISCLNLKIGEMSIDGYLVPRLEGYAGKNLSFKVVATFMPKRYLQGAKKVLNGLGMEAVKFVHLAESISRISSYEEKESLFIDTGAAITQLFLVKGDNLRQADEFKIGGADFTEKLAEDLGLDGDSAEDLKKRYSSGALSIEAAKKIKDLFEGQQGRWYSLLKNKIQKVFQKDLLDLNVYLLGGGSLLPEIREVLERRKESAAGGYQAFGKSSVKLIYPKDLKYIESIASNIKSPYMVSSLLICYHAQ